MLALRRALAAPGYRCPSVARVRPERPLHHSPRVLGLLKGIDPILTGDLLCMLRSAGHGDEVVVVDCNFPAHEVASKTVTGKVIQLAGVDVVQACDAICSVFPLDGFVPHPVRHMAPDAGVTLPPLGKEVADLAKAAIWSHSPGVAIEPVERTPFYAEARRCFAVVQASGERRPYANFILKKGVVGPDGKDLLP